MRYLYATLFFLVTINVSAQTTDWVKSFGGDLADKGISIGTDSLGYIYISGYFNTAADFGEISLINNDPMASNKEAFLCKVDSLGNVLWALAGGDLAGGCCDDRALGMHVTPGGDVYITGTFWYVFVMDSCPNPGGNADDTSVLAKIDSDGNCVWTIAFGAQEGAGDSCSCINQSTSLFTIPTPSTRKLDKVVDALGREVNHTNNQILFYIYDDGSVEKKFFVE